MSAVLRRRRAPTGQILHLSSGSVRLRPWRSDSPIAQVVPLEPGRPISAPDAAVLVRMADAAGYREIVTSALLVGEQSGFAAAGFEVRERLHLLSHSLRRVPSPPREPALRTARSADHPDLLRVDSAAFGTPWHFDSTALADAVAATPWRYLRVNRSGAVSGYALSGRAGHTGYLQRLAVHPAQQGHGLGRALVLDALRWMRRRGASLALVNTHVGNDRAVALYERLGFVHEPGGLAVLGRVISGGASPTRDPAPVAAGK